MIIQEQGANFPDDSARGGSITFDFDEPVLVSDIGMMDIDETGQRMRFKYSTSRWRETFRYVGFGDNSVQRVIANKRNVKQLIVVLESSGAITELNFCPKCI